jgi:hypothetical protein
MWKCVSAALGLILLTTPAFAQDKRVDVNLGGGVIFPVSDIKDDFDPGWNITFGATINANEKSGFLVDYTYDRMLGPEKTILVSPTPGGIGSSQLIESNHQMHVGTFNYVYKMSSSSSSVGGYLLGGVGIFHRIVQLTSPAIGYATVCDPYWYVCYPAAVSVDNILGDKSSNDFGINLGGGVTFGSEAKFYVEMRYQQVFGKTIEPTTVGNNVVCPNECSTSATYFPITFGIRW